MQRSLVIVQTIEMSSGVVRSAISSTLDDSEFCIKSVNADATKKLAASLLDAVVEDEKKMDSFDAFSNTLLRKIKTASSVAQEKLRSNSFAREKAWASFHLLRTEELPSLWTGLFDDINLQERDCIGINTKLNITILSLSPCHSFHLLQSDVHNYIFILQLFSLSMSTRSCLPTVC